ncbi:MAG TPA: helix-turn-helix domain-containing protein [Bryobacteraceae bacterium]|nr:helix-turn-helix domain-containing protein [Bryobacteraceae bacterium]
MVSLGQKLKDERLRQGKQLRQIADELRIGSRYLEAIEAEDWKQLPGGFFNRSFVRQYAQSLGLNPSKIEEEFNALVRPDSAVDMDAMAKAYDPRARLDEEKKLISVEPLRGSSSGFFDSKTGLAAAALVLLVAGGGALTLFVDRWNSPKDVRKQSSASMHAPVTPAPAAAVEKQAEQPAGASEAPPKIVPTISTDPDGNLTLNIEATEQTWIEVTADGKRIFMGVLEKGDKKRISTLQRARMVVGNAGGIAVSKGGRDIGPIGPRGQVRTVNITQEGVEIVEPKKPADTI